MIRNVRRGMAFGVSIAAAAAVGLSMASPAQASINDCATGDACLWSDAYYAGDRWQWQASVDTLPDWIADQASSARNNGRHCRADFYTLPYHEGERLPMNLQDHRDNLALDLRPSGYSWNDSISSLRWVC